MLGYKSIIGITCIPLGLTNISVWAPAQHDKTAIAFVTEETRKYRRKHCRRGRQSDGVARNCSAFAKVYRVGAEFRWIQNSANSPEQYMHMFWFILHSAPQKCKETWVFLARGNQNIPLTCLVYFTWTFLKHVLTLICIYDTSFPLLKTIQIYPCEKKFQLFSFIVVCHTSD